MREAFRRFAQTASRQFEKVSPLVGSKKLPWIIIAFGIVARTGQYLFNRSLWMDEATLALNIINRSFGDLLKPLDNEQAAPIGFLMIERLAVLAFGDSEYSLRLLPFLCGIASLFLFYEVARRLLSPGAVLIALTYFAAMNALIYFSSEVKQYSSDVAATLLIFLLALYIHSKQLTPRRVLLFAATGAIAVWMSHPAIFVLAGAGTTLIIASLLRKDWPRAAALSAASLFWALNFAALYFLSLRNIGANQGLEASWARRGAFMPLPPKTVSDLYWFPTYFLKIFSDPIQSKVALLAATLFVVGCLSALVRKKRSFLILVTPIFFALLASGLHKYPFARRLVIFIVPALLIIVAEGAEYIINLKHPYSAIIGIALVAVLLTQPVALSSYHIAHPRVRQEIRPVIEYVLRNWQPDDRLYIYYGALPSFTYYANRFKIEPGSYIPGIKARGDWRGGRNETYIEDLNRLGGLKRLWALFSHVRNIRGVNEQEFMLNHLDSMGPRLDRFKSPAAGAYLYDLGSAAPPVAKE